jgi:transposase-like protein
MEKRTRRVFPAEYKAEAVRLSRAGSGNIAATARQLGIDVTTLRDWLRRDNASMP